MSTESCGKRKRLCETSPKPGRSRGVWSVCIISVIGYSETLYATSAQSTALSGSADTFLLLLEPVTGFAKTYLNTIHNHDGDITTQF